MDVPKVSVIILNYNGHRFLGELLSKCIESVLLSDYPCFEVFFVDNASTDDSVALVKNRFGSDSRLKIVQNSENLGFTEGNNVGLRLAQGEYSVLLNNDTYVDASWLKNLVKAGQPSSVGAVQSKLLLMSKPDLMDCAGGFIDCYGYPTERGQRQAASQYTQISECFYGKGASLLLKHEALKKSGLFDRDIFMYYDETDLCWRLRLAGYKIVFCPTSIVYHAAGATASRTYEEKLVYFCRRNQLMLLIKNFELMNMFKAVLVFVICEVRTAILCGIRGKHLAGLAIFRALFWNLCNLRRTWEKRVVVQKLVRKVSDREIKQSMIKTCQPSPIFFIFLKACYLKLRQKK